jgi:hypothetical protein
MFPAGLPGLALLLLRGSVVIALLIEDYGCGNAVFGWRSSFSCVRINA